MQCHVHATKVLLGYVVLPVCHGELDRQQSLIVQIYVTVLRRYSICNGVRFCRRIRQCGGYRKVMVCLVHRVLVPAVQLCHNTAQIRDQS